MISGPPAGVTLRHCEERSDEAIHMTKDAAFVPTDS
jgi:hypothetical protein